jgi:predicted nucleic acid-binding protein
MIAQRASYDCVVDASVGIKLFLVELLSDRADALLGHLNDALPARFYVPDLFFIECTNILWKYVRRFGYPPEAAQQDVVELIQLPFQVVSTAALAGPALSLALDRGITAYDASYVVLADRLALPLVTTDEPLIRNLAGSGLDVRFLGDWP